MGDEKGKKIKSTFLTMVFVLTIVSIISAFSLGFTFIKTKDKIAYNKQLKIIEAIKVVLPPDYDNTPSEEKYVIKDQKGVEIIFYLAKKEGQIIGTAIKTYSDNAFNERIILMVGLDINQKIIDIFVNEQSETPGLGTKITKPKFLNQFKNKNPMECNIKKKGGPIDGITAATISSKAFCEAVQHGFKVFQEKGDVLK